MDRLYYEYGCDNPILNSPYEEPRRHCPEMSLQRVADRVKRGGHDVPKADVRRRFPRTLSNLFNLYWFLLEADEIKPKNPMKHLNNRTPEVVPRGMKLPLPVHLPEKTLKVESLLTS